MSVAAIVTTHRAEQELGPPVTIDGKVRWLSASAIVKADPGSEGGCPARFWFHYRGSLLGVSQREPETEAMNAGTETHKEIEQHLTTGAMCLGPVAMSGRHFIDEPGPGLSVEQSIILGGHGQITGVWLRVAGIPYAGHLDVYNHRGAAIDASGQLRELPPNTLEVKDWKTTSDLKWAKNPEQVANAIPMTGYAMAGFAMWPAYERAQMTHVYFQRGGRRGALLSSARRERRQIERRWEYASGIARSIVDIAREDDPNKIPVDTDACYSYNTPCPHLHVCARGRAARMNTTLTASLGPRMAALVSGDFRTALNNTSQGESEMGLLKDVGIKKPAAPAPEVSVSFEDLIAEEAQGRAEATAPRPMPLIAGWQEAWATILGSGLGRPALGGDAALMHDTDAGVALVEGSIVAGDGKLAKLARIDDPAKLIELGAQIRKKLEVEAAKARPVTERVARVDPPIELLPADAPASRPALAADPVEGLDNAKTRELAAARGAATPGEAIAKAIPTLTAEQKANPQVTIHSVTPTPVAPGVPEQLMLSTEPALEVEVPARRGRPPGSKNKEGTLRGSVDTAAVSIYVDVTVDGLALKLLDGYVKTANDALCAAWGCKDVRLADNTTQGGYGKGMTVLVSMCLEAPPPAGAYYVDTRSNPLVEAVAVALRQTCLDSGGVFVRGIR